MQANFLDIYTDLMNNKHPKITGLWLVYGDDPLAFIWFIEACRPIFAKNSQIIKRIELHSAKDWENVLYELGSLSLFGEDMAVILTGKAKPNADVLKALKQFAEHAHNNQNNHALIYNLPNQDKRAKNSAIFGLFANEGYAIDAQIHNEILREKILKIKAKTLGITLDNEAWRCVMSQTENNLLSAYQALMRAADLYFGHTAALNSDQMLKVLVSDYHYSVFNLADNILMGNTATAYHILMRLKQTDTAPSIVLWAISKEIGQVLRLQDGQSPEKLGIWKNKTTLYYNAARSGRFAPSQLTDIYHIDKAIKGLSAIDSWILIEKLLLKLCITKA